MSRISVRAFSEGKVFRVGSQILLSKPLNLKHLYHLFELPGFDIVPALTRREIREARQLTTVKRRREKMSPVHVVNATGKAPRTRQGAELQKIEEHSD